MDSKNQNTIRRLQEQIEIQKTQLEQEVGSRKQAEESVKVLTEELTALKNCHYSKEAATEERMRFDVLVSEISAQFINLPSGQVDCEIEDAQRRVCDCLDIDMCSLWQWVSENPDELVLTHLYRPLGGTPIPDRLEASKKFPWSLQQLMAAKTYVISSIEDLPAEAAPQVESWRYFGIKSSVGIPLTAGLGQPFGAITFHNIQDEHKWSDTIVNRLQLVAQIFANAIARKLSDEILRESERRLSLATEAAGVGLWAMDIDTKKFWASAKAKELFCFAANEEISYESFINKIHPEDRKQVNQVVQQAIQSGNDINSDYRIMLPDGSIRWIGSRGKQHFNPDGDAYRLMGASLDVTERMRAENELRENLRFESLIADISAHFVNLPPGEVDIGILAAQRKVCEYLGLDVSALWQWTLDDPDRLIMTHIYRSVDGPPVPENMDANEFFPWCQKELRAGRIISVSSMDNLPPEASQDVEAWCQFEIKTSLTIPLITGSGPPFGGISFNDMQSERMWTDSLVNRLEVVVQVFANALDRKRADENLRESERRLSLATEAAGAGLWSMNIDTEKVWISSKLRKLFCFAEEEEISYLSFFEKIHPDDRDRVFQEVNKALLDEDELRIDYRILHPDESIRWIGARGHRHIKPDGEPDQLMGVSLDITERMILEDQLRDKIQEIELLKKRLENENIYLQKEIKSLGDHGNIVGQSLSMKRILAEAEQVAATDSTALILGETGTGKEMLARFIHQMSARKDRPLVTINCSSLPPTLIESELFGREKGAYTGAMTKMAGRFEIADGSTLFLDEIGELPTELQVKLLRVLEEGVFERLGSTKPVHVNVRILAATNRDIENEVEKGRFRQDLFYRLNVFPIVIPPLRDRSGDIPLLVWSFVQEFQKRMGKNIETISKKAMESLQYYCWPGNVRELRNVIEHAMILSQNSTLTVHLPKSGLKEKDQVHNLIDVERQHITSVLKQTRWQVGGKGGAAEILGLKRSTLQSKMKKLGIVRPDF